MKYAEHREPLKNSFSLSNIEDTEKQRLFLEYLDSALGSYRESSTGCSYYDTSGDYIDESVISINKDNIFGSLLIRIVASESDELKSIEFESQGSDLIDKLFNKLIVDSLASALGAKKIKFFRRVWFCYIGERLDGEYWFGRNLRIAPVDPEDPNPHFMSAERYISIDLNVEAIDAFSASAIARNIGSRWAARFSLILDLGIYAPSYEHRWTISESNTSACELRQLGYWYNGPRIEEMPRKGKVCQPGKYEHSLHHHIRFVGESVKFPSEARKLIAALDRCDSKTQSSFDNCAFLYQLALTAGSTLPTVKLSYLVASIDALCKSDTTYTDPSSFIRHYANSMHDIEHLLNFMHGSVRSAHFHAGEFAFDEFDQKPRISIYSGSLNRQSNHRYDECLKLIRCAIANWAGIKITEFPAMS